MHQSSIELSKVFRPEVFFTQGEPLQAYALYIDNLVIHNSKNNQFLYCL